MVNGIVAKRRTGWYVTGGGTTSHGTDNVVKVAMMSVEVAKQYIS